ncbi:Phosphoglycerate dehydrogenase [Marivirga sericea]|uniref:Phosphoglycerate dehydrogenase n=1 Tax=Marivirga sericea TaxID=1028 RepID=A0A1X7JWY3_9BACT|nr:D-2-hydroxyacid dehydrogenase [Marivirga sericea]SMG32766.1 Phosphoglycerate dehydrogenase [Marivirga sericea]
MSKKNILTYGHLAEGFQAFIAHEYPELNCLLAKDKEEVEKLLPTAHYIAGFNFLSKMDIDHIEWIHSFGAGVDSFIKLNLPEKCTLTKTKGKMGQRMSEYCLSYILQDLNRTELYKINQASKTWDQVIPKSLSKQSVIFFGTGNISTDIAQVLQPMVKNIVGINTSGKNKEFFDVCISFDNLDIGNLEANAIVINTLPATEKTQNLFNKEFFSQLENILFINIGRGNSVDEADLLEALDQKHIRQAVLDVFKQEPLPKESTLWEHPKCIVTPHISGITLLEDVKQSFKLAYEAVKSGDEHKLLVNTQKGY